MKREGRQHGMVRSIQILPSPLTLKSDRRHVNELSSPPTAGVFTKVSRKPTNHSKFTGKCGVPRCIECHDLPVCKSKVKVKGSHRIKDSETRFDYSRFSATGIFDHLGGYGSEFSVDYYQEDDVFYDNELDSYGRKDVEDKDEGWYLV